MKHFSFCTVFSLLIFLLFACGTAAFYAIGMYHPGTYEGSADGYFGLITVSVSVSEDAITGLEVLDHAETEGVGTTAFEELTAEIILTNSTDVDVVSGASGSSEGFIAAVNNALLKAKAE